LIIKVLNRVINLDWSERFLKFILFEFNVIQIIICILLIIFLLFYFSIFTSSLIKFISTLVCVFLVAVTPYTRYRSYARHKNIRIEFSDVALAWKAIDEVFQNTNLHRGRLVEQHRYNHAKPLWSFALYQILAYARILPICSDSIRGHRYRLLLQAAQFLVCAENNRPTDHRNTDDGRNISIIYS